MFVVYFNRSSRDAYLLELARDSTQFIIGSIWQLPTERVEDVIVAKFPPPVTRLPREKPLPKPKPMTKWEKYAKEKGWLPWLALMIIIAADLVYKIKIQILELVMMAAVPLLLFLYTIEERFNVLFILFKYNTMSVIQNFSFLQQGLIKNTSLLH